jgi:hypothetical protein
MIGRRIIVISGVEWNRNSFISSRLVTYRSDRHLDLCSSTHLEYPRLSYRLVPQHLRSLLIVCAAGARNGFGVLGEGNTRGL